MAFLEGYARALVAAETRWDRARTWLREHPSARAESPVRAGRRRRSARSRSSFPAVRSERDVSRLAQEVFALPARLADARRRKVVVALDEFQAIGGFNGGSVEHAMRAAVQHQREVGYVFAGSEPSLMERMLGPKRPFYKAGPVMRLEKIPADEFAAFIDARFARSGIKPKPGLARRSSSSPATFPTTCSVSRTRPGTKCARRRRRRATLEDLHQALRRLLTEQQMMFEATLAAPDAGAARACCARSCSKKDASSCRPTSARAIAWAAVDASRPRSAALVRDDVVAREGERYVVVDSLLREWVARRTH